MPSQFKRPGLCIIGDSHLGSLRRAVDAGLVRFPDDSYEFWGAAGPGFRKIHMHNGVLRAKGYALDMVLKVNGNGRAEVCADDFDSFLFYGCRLRIADFFVRYMDRLHSGIGLPSRAVLDLAAESFLNATRAFRIAAELAANGAHVGFAPTSFPTLGVVDYTAPGQFFETYRFATRATREDRAALWLVLREQASSFGVALIQQPDDTVVEGVFTDAVFGIEGAAVAKDISHKTPEFSARMLGMFEKAQSIRAA